MRLIADELRKEIDKQAYPYSDSTANDIYFSVLHLLADAPTADAEPVRHGKWLNEPPYTAGGKYLKGQECSICHSYFVSDGNKPYSNHPYCPQCGAKMDGE